MTTARSIDTYGGEFADAVPIEDPTTEQAAAYANRLHEDVAQMTNTTAKWVVTFPTTTTAAPVTVTASGVLVHSHFGSGSAAKPVVAKPSANGTYTLTFASSYTDGLAETETTTLFAARASIMSSTQCAVVPCTIAGTVVTVYVRDSATQALSDLGGSVTVLVEVWTS